MSTWSLTKTLFILSVSLLTASAKCKSVAYPHRFQFYQQVELHPYQKIYHIGDTLTIEYTDTAGMAFDTITHAPARVDSFTYRLRTGIGRMDPSKNKPGPGPVFFVSNDGAAFSPGATDVSYNVTNVDANVGCGGGADIHYMVKFVPRKPGVYLIDMITYHYNGLVYCSNGAPAGAGMEFFFNLADCNADLLSETDVVSEELPTYTNVLSQKRGFLFKVE